VGRPITAAVTTSPAEFPPARMVSGTMATVNAATSPPATAAHVRVDTMVMGGSPRKRAAPSRGLITRAP
jgi:hypothetical protein